MSVYKIIFARNKAMSCQVVKEQIKLQGAYSYEHDKGNLIYALVVADNEEHAMSMGDAIVKEVTDKVFGSDFIN